MEYLDFYYKDNAKELRKLCDKALLSLRFEVSDKSDFYSLANEIFLSVLNKFDKQRDFDDFLFSCLSNKFKTEMTRRNRMKRGADKNAISLDIQIGENEDCSMIETIKSDYCLEDNVFGKEEEFSSSMKKYLANLSPLQRKIALLIGEGV